MLRYIKLRYVLHSRESDFNFVQTHQVIMNYIILHYITLYYIILF